MEKSKTITLIASISGGVAALLLIISSFMPYATILGESINLFNKNEDKSEGIIMCVIAGLALLMCFFLYSRVASIFNFIFSLAAFGFTRFEVSDFKNGARYAFGLIKKGAGYHLMVISSILMLIIGVVRIVFSFRYKRLKKKIRCKTTITGRVTICNIALFKC